MKIDLEIKESNRSVFGAFVKLTEDGRMNS